MSSSRRSEVLRRWRPAGWSLRTRLLVALIVLVAGVCATIGTATTIEVYRFQVGRLDDQLMANAAVTANAGHQPGGDDDGPHGTPPNLAQGLGTIATYVNRSTDTHTQVIFTSAGPQPLSDAQVAVLLSLPPDHQPHTREIPGLGSYRLIAGEAQDHDPLFTGLPMSDVDATRNALVALEIGIGLAASVLAGLIGENTNQSTLRPPRRLPAAASL